MKNYSNFNEVFHYNPDSGELRWKADTGFKRMKGKVAGKRDPKGYLVVGCFKKDHRVHRIIWEMVNGQIPDGMQVDHINGIRNDNRISNLRLVIHQDNQRNMATPRSNSSGIIGVGWDKRTGKWRAKIMVNRETVCLGRYSDIEEAAIARKRAESFYGFHENHGRCA